MNTLKIKDPELHRAKIICLILLSFFYGGVTAQTWQSQKVKFNSSGKLEYKLDSEKNRIPDFSFAGYKNGEQALPQAPVVKTIQPVAGDNTSHIQNAINEVGAMPKNANGIRGALLLEAGLYEITGSLKVNYDGVIIRGAGNNADPAVNTIIFAKGDNPHQRTVLTLGGGSEASKWKEQVSGTKTNITTDSVLVGTNTFEVENASSYSVGDNIVIYHPCSDNWLKEVNYGGTAADSLRDSWKVGSYPIFYNRYIKEISGNRITVDVPVYNHLIKSLSQCYIYKYARTGLYTNIGVENLRVDIETHSSTDTSHAWNAIAFIQTEDSWASNCVATHFGLAGFYFATASRITVQDCKAIDPSSIVEGGSRYNFNLYQASQQILIKYCHASNGRHHYVSNGTASVSGIVFLKCTSFSPYTSSEGHRSWSQGMLWDNHKELGPKQSGGDDRFLALYNRGDYGTAHGWAVAHSVAWNCDVATGELIVQKPPTAQNYAIGCFGRTISGQSPPAPYNQPPGWIEGSNRTGIEIPSLYEAQFLERTGSPVKISNDDNNIVSNDFMLMQNYPNPFNPSTVIKYKLNKPATVKIKIYDLLGRRIAVPVDEFQNSGTHSFHFNAGDYHLPSGVYFYELTAGSKREIKKMSLIK